VFEEITEITRELEVEMGEVTPENLRVLENAGAPTTIAAAPNKSAQKALKFGSFSVLTARRICFIGMRNPGSGLVTEPVGGITRGRFVMFCLYQATIAADSSEVSAEKGELTSLPVTFSAKPEGGQPQGQEYGTWLLEDAGTISAS
jgi:hypothetical protein